MGIGKMPLKLKATITIEIDAKDYLDAADIEKGIKSLTEQLSEKFITAEYDIKERRDRDNNSSQKTKASRQL
jgi:hypothetical protein